jgi:hypothetical protein
MASNVESEQKSKVGPILYIVVSILSIWFFYWFAAVVDH